MTTGAQVNESWLVARVPAPPKRSRLRRPSRGTLVLLGAVAVVAAFGITASRQQVTADGSGYAIEPGGDLTAGSMFEDGPVVAFPEGTPARFRLSLPVRNPGRLPVTVTYPADFSPPFDLEGPTRSVRVPAGGTAWLETAWDYHGCPGITMEQSSWMAASSIPVRVRPWGWFERDRWVELPIAIQVPGVTLPQACYQRPAP